MRFEVFMVVKIQVKVFWVVMLSGPAVGYQHFGGPYCLHLQGEVHNARKWTWEKEQGAGQGNTCKPIGR
jgi:hypothetical protein